MPYKNNGEVAKKVIVKDLTYQGSHNLFNL